MAYATYITKALVCGSKDSYTSDRSYLLFTKEAGMLWATARSVREERSKQRFALQDFSFVRVTLVKGKSGWKIGSVEAEGNAFLAARSRSERAFVTNIVSLLRRYIHGEQALPQVFSDVETALAAASEGDGDRQLIFTARLLYHLGYISKVPALVTVLTADSLPEASAPTAPAERVLLETVVNQAHQESHL